MESPSLNNSLLNDYQDVFDEERKILTIEDSQKSMEILHQSMNSDSAMSINDLSQSMNSSLGYASKGVTVNELQERIELLLCEMKNRENKFYEVISGKNKTLDQLQKNVYILENKIENLEVQDQQMQAIAYHTESKKFTEQKDIDVEDLSLKMAEIQIEMYKEFERLSKTELSLKKCKKQYKAETMHNSDLRRKMQHLERILGEMRRREKDLHELLKIELKTVQDLETERDLLVKEIEVLTDKVQEAVCKNKNIEEMIAVHQLDRAQNQHEVYTLRQAVHEKDEQINKFVLKEKEWKANEKFMMDKIIDLDAELKIELNGREHHAALKHEFEQKISILSQELELAVSNQLKDRVRRERLEALEEKNKLSIQMIEDLSQQLNEKQTELQKAVNGNLDLENGFENERQSLQSKIETLELEAKSNKELALRFKKEKSDLKEIMTVCKLELAHVQCELRRSEELRADDRRLFEKHECENKLLKQRIKEEQHNLDKTVQEKTALEKRIIALNTKYMYGLNRSSSIRSACFKMPEVSRTCDTNDIGRSWCVIDMDNLSVDSMNISKSVDKNFSQMMSFMSLQQPDMSRGYNSELHISGVSDIRHESPYSVISHSDNILNNKDVTHGPLTSSHLDQTNSVPHGIGNLFSCEDEPLHVDYEWDQLSILKDTNTVIKKPLQKKVEKKDFLSKSWHNISMGSQKDKDVFKKPFTKRTPKQKSQKSGNQENIAPSRKDGNMSSTTVDVQKKNGILKEKDSNTRKARLSVLSTAV